MKIATHNVNGIQGRLETLLTWLAQTRPDIVCLQELKAPQAQSPERELARAGYEVVCHGPGRRWNGVAIPSRQDAPLLTRRGLSQDPDPCQCGCIEAAVNGLMVSCPRTEAIPCSRGAAVIVAWSVITHS